MPCQPNETTRVSDLPPGLLDYFEARERDHLHRVEMVLQGMNPRERKLVREAAVMGYVRGEMQGRISAGGGGIRAAGRDYPGDRAVLIDVIGACLSMADLYPTITRLERVGERRTQREANRG